MLARIPDVSHAHPAEIAPSRRLTSPEHTFAQTLTEESSTSSRQVSATGGGKVQFFGGWTAGLCAPPAAQPATAASAESQAPFVPQFLTNVQVLSSMGGSEPLNPAYFATQETAQYIADKFGTGKIVQVPWGGTGGPYAATAQEYHIVLPNGATVNAGLLADYYVRMPEAQFPGLADTMIQMAIAKAEVFNT